LAAARHGADALLVVQAACDQIRDTNGWAATYALVIPVLFAPAGELETVFHTNATMFDVRNGYLYMAAESEAENEQKRAHVWLDSDEGLEVARAKAIEDLGKELGEQLEGMHAQAERGGVSGPLP
jgi:hypothetical protein